MTATRIDPEALAGLASRALADGTEDEAAPVLEAAARQLRTNARLWQWAGLLQRSLDEHELALSSFAEAARLGPEDASIAHGHARVALEAGLDARQLFDRALKLKPSGDVLLGRAAAGFGAGEGEAAADELAAILEHNPLWAQGHIQWAQLASMIGRADEASATVDRALALHAGDKGLWQAALHILVGAERHKEACEKANAAIAATGDTVAFALTRAAALSDAGEIERAETEFSRLGEPSDVNHAIHLARLQIRAGHWQRLFELAELWMSGEAAHHFWPYASIAWRQAGDSRWQWLEGDERLVRTFDLTPKLSSLDALTERLRRIHARSGRFLDQSVRGGTQTDGPLLSRIDHEIRELRAAIVEAVEEYRRQLPPADPAHPMLRHRRDRPIRFAGSWSVRLAAMGHHSHHVHPQGWISSAFYVAVPEALTGEEGWLTLGEPQSGLGLDLPPIRRIAPGRGQLVLFPSMMWHGTLPFSAGERMTVAFDVALPR